MLSWVFGRIIGYSPIIILLILASITPCMGMLPVKNETQIESLVGIQNVYVIVNIGLSREGPTKFALQEEVENYLRDEGIGILEDIEAADMSTVPIFNVNVSVWQNIDQSYTYFVQANFYQPVYLNQNKELKIQAVTWQSKIIGSGFLKNIHKDVTRVTKIFVRNIQTVNDKELYAK